MDLDSLRKNYDLISICFFNTDKETPLYEYFNMTNTFVEGNSTLSSLVID